MSFQFIPYQYPLFSTAALALFLALYFMGRKKPRLVLLLADVFLYTFTTGLDNGAVSYPVKFTWHIISQAFLIWLPVLWLDFVLQYTRARGWNNPALLTALHLVPLLGTVMLMTNPYHGLYWQSIHLQIGQVEQARTVIPGPVGWITELYDVVAALLSIFVLVRMMWNGRTRPNSQTVILLVCTVIPSFSLVFTILPQPPLNTVDITPYVLHLMALLFGFALFYYRLKDMTPIGYEGIIAGMREAVMVLGLKNTIIHANPAAAAVLGKPVEKLLGMPLDQALANYPELLEQCRADRDEVLAEVTLNTGDTTVYYELYLSPLHSRHGDKIGRLITLRNIVKRVQAENASRQNQLLLKQSEEKYRSLVENIDEVIFTMSLDGMINYISPVVERLTGSRPETMIGKKIYDLVYPDDLPGLKEQIDKMAAGAVQYAEFRIANPKGNIHCVRMFARPIQQDGRLAGLQAVIMDITERKQVEEALERRASQLAILNYIGEQIAASIELNSILDSATRLIQKHFGYYHVGIFTPNFENGELSLRSTSGSFSELFPRDHHLKFGQGMVGWAAMNKTTILANDVRLEPRYTNLYPDKIPTRAELAVPILIGDNKMAGVLDIQSPLVNAFDDNDVRVMKTVADQIAIALENARLYEEARRQLKERERKENILRIQRDLLMRLSSAKSLDETLQVAVETLSTELRASRVAISLVDWDCRTVLPVVSLGYPLNRPVLPTPLDRSFAGWVARNGQPALISNVNANKSELELPPGTLTLLCAPLIANNKVIGVISLESGQRFAFSQDDLRLLTTLANSLVILIERARLFDEVERARTELENRATELEQANARLRELDRLKSQFLANMSHELRTPLNSIIGFSEVLVDDLAGSLSDEQKEFVQDILDSGQHLLNLINDLLDFSKIESGRMVLEPSTFDVGTLFEELRIAIAPLIEKKGQVLVFRQDGPLPTVTADHLRIKQVFINLLGNANKFTPEGGLITASCRQHRPDELLFAVHDTGIGIRPEDQEIIFEEFRQVDGSLTREVSGTGLGLSISKRILEMHNGCIWVESELGRGSTFYVRLPVNGHAPGLPLQSGSTSTESGN